MTKHDKGVLRVARRLLRKGSTTLSIGSKVVTHQAIERILIKEFPTKKISIHK